MYKLFVCLRLVNCVMNRQNERVTIIELHKLGMKTAEIVRTTGFKQSTVYQKSPEFCLERFFGVLFAIYCKFCLFGFATCLGRNYR